MARYLVRRMILVAPVLVLVTMVTFLISHTIPGDPARLVAGPRATPEQVQRLREQWGLDKPLPEQYVRYIARLVRGDLGMSLRTNRPVAANLREFFPATVELALAAMVLALTVGILSGVLSASMRNSAIDHVVRLITLAGVSVPPFALGLLLLFLFYFWLGVLPGAGRTDLSHVGAVTGLLLVDAVLHGRWDLVADAICHLVLPSLTLAASYAASIARITRSSVLEVLGQDYVRTARAKGLAERVVLYRHALKNALLPVVTQAGMGLGSMLSGSVLVETVFAWPGLGSYMVQSIYFLDFAAIMGGIVLITVIFLAANLCCDLLYGWLDPKIRFR